MTEKQLVIRVTLRTSWSRTSGHAYWSEQHKKDYPRSRKNPVLDAIKRKEFTHH